MFHLLESIRIENKELCHIELHNERFNRSRKKLFGCNNKINLIEHIQLPTKITSDRYKCRVSTSDGKTIKVEIQPYQQRKVNSLKLVEMEEIEYSIKTDQREALNAAFARRANCDDIIIVKNNCLTDAWAANVIFFNGTNWTTPKTPLLKGIQREYLLLSGKITEQIISGNDLAKFEKVKLINALIDFDRAPEIAIKKIVL